MTRSRSLNERVRRGRTADTAETPRHADRGVSPVGVRTSALREDVNDAYRVAHDPAMHAVVDRQDLDRAAASAGQMAVSRRRG